MQNRKLYGAIYDKEIVKMKKFRWSAKDLYLYNVGVGGVLSNLLVPGPHWPAKDSDVFRNSLAHH